MHKLTALTFMLLSSLSHAEKYVAVDSQDNRLFERTNYRTEGKKLCNVLNE
ncbi:unannotated protein [freshwater metagenome]|uniref:Unannotated protein n=1 Tax=freshwater metagenome TaxID=449393 RepID=A0A6J7WD65_9ZZZZ